MSGAIEAKTDMPKRCKNCRHFERGHWLPEYGGGDQLGGNCKALCEILKMTNSYLVWRDSLYVQESFGCFLFSEPINNGSEVQP